MGMWLCEGKLKVKIAGSLPVAVRVSKSRVLNLPNKCLQRSLWFGFNRLNYIKTAPLIKTIGSLK